MRNLVFAGAALLLCAAAPWVGGSEPRTVIRPCLRPPVIDGVLGAEWDQCAQIGNLGLLSVKRLVPDQTEVYLTYDHECLYVGFRCHHRGEPPRAVSTRRDGNLDADDALQFIIQPNPKVNSNYSFTGNSKGVFADAHNADASWDGPWVYRATTAAGYWEGEFSIPFSAIEMQPPAPGFETFFNVVRSRCGANDAPTVSAYGRALSYTTSGKLTATLHFGAPGGLVAQTKPFVLTGERVGYRVVVLNTGDVPRPVAASVAIQDWFGKDIRRNEYRFELHPGESREIGSEYGPDCTYTYCRTSVSDMAEAAGGEVLNQKMLYLFATPLTISGQFFHDRIEATLDLRTAGVSRGAGDAETAKGLRVRWTVVDADKGKAVVGTTSAGAAGAAKATAGIGLRHAPAGAYRLDARVMDSEGRTVYATSGRFTKPEKPPWQDSKIGISDAVIPPWTPVTVKGDVVSCWGRDYVFSGSFLPSQVSTQGESLLAAPVTLSAVIGGRPVRWGRGSVSVKDRKPGWVRLESRVPGDAARIDGTAVVEFDGFSRYDFRVTAKGAPLVESLTLEIPFTKAAAALMAAQRTDSYMQGTYPYWRGAPNGLVPAAGASGPFTPFIWLGNNRVGMAWFMESPQGWSNADESRVIEINSTPDVVVLRLKIIDQPLRLAEPLYLSFGLQATPLRPLGEEKKLTMGSRFSDMYPRKVEGTPAGQPDRSRLQTLAEEGNDIVQYHENWTESQGYPKTVSHQRLIGDWVKAAHAEGMQAILYLGCQLGDNTPEFKLYKDEIVTCPWTETSGWFREDHFGCYDVGCKDDADFETHYGADTCYGCEQYANFVLWSIDRLIQDYDIDGLYLDGAFEPWKDENTLHGCGYIDRKGVLKPSWPIYRLREFMKRMRVIGNSRKPGFWIDQHTVGVVWTPSMSFGSSYFSGEHYAALCHGDPQRYTTVMNPDIYRATFMGTQYGLVPYYLSGIGNPEAPQAISHIHNVVVRGSGDALDTADMRAFRRVAAWHPYYENQDYVQVSDPDVKVSLWEQKGARVVLAPTNFGKSAVQVSIFLNGTKVVLPDRPAARNMTTGEAIPFTGNVLRVTLEPWKPYLYEIVSGT
jgi:hypothetical protein